MHLNASPPRESRWHWMPLHWHPGRSQVRAGTYMLRSHLRSSRLEAAQPPYHVSHTRKTVSAHPDSCQMSRPRLPRRQMHGMTQKIVRACHRLSLGRQHRSSHRNFFRRTSPERHALLRRSSMLMAALCSSATPADRLWRRVRSCSRRLLLLPEQRMRSRLPS